MSTKPPYIFIYTLINKLQSSYLDPKQPAYMWERKTTLKTILDALLFNFIYFLFYWCTPTFHLCSLSCLFLTALMRTKEERRACFSFQKLSLREGDVFLCLLRSKRLRIRRTGSQSPTAARKTGPGKERRGRRREVLDPAQ